MGTPNDSMEEGGGSISLFANIVLNAGGGVGAAESRRRKKDRTGGAFLRGVSSLQWVQFEFSGARS